MYKPSKRKLEKGIIANRKEFFYSKGREYTFFYYDHENVVNIMKNWWSTQNQRMYHFEEVEGKPYFVIWIIGDCQLDVYRTAKKEITYDDGTVGYAATYVALFTRWKYFGVNLSCGDEMNEMLTTLELGLLRMDPFTWVREVPSKTHVAYKQIGHGELWESDGTDRTLTREAATKKGLGEGYLADSLNGMGIQVYGGTALAQVSPPYPNPLIEERVQRNLELEEEKKNAPEPENAVSKQNTLKTYTGYYEVEVGEPLDPFIHAQIDENKNIIPEPQDHGFIEIQLAGITIFRRPPNAESYYKYYENDMNRDNYLYVSDSRVAFINRKYNKKEGGSWIGFGGAAAYMIAETINVAGKAIKAAQRRDKALAGHLRYEWIGVVGYKHKQKRLDHEELRLVYQDIEGSAWNMCFKLAGVADAEIIANDILRRIANYRLRTTKEFSEEALAEIRQFQNGRMIPKEQDPSAACGEVIPGAVKATTGAEYRPAD